MVAVPVPVAVKFTLNEPFGVPSKTEKALVRPIDTICVVSDHNCSMQYPGSHGGGLLAQLGPGTAGIGHERFTVSVQLSPEWRHSGEPRPSATASPQVAAAARAPAEKIA
jgi:hypothetical protein